jgi:cysteine desulfurase family protein (TIGR01976 family)
MSIDVASIRAQFPALSREVNGQPAVYLDGPGGTQVPRSVIDAMSGFMERGGSNLEGAFVSSAETMETVAGARAAVADLINAQPGEVAFGQNMTSLTFATSRAIAGSWNEADEIVVTRLDHDANITPWVMAAGERGSEVRWADFDPEGGGFDYDSLGDVLGPKTRLVAVTAASNALGTIVDVARIAEMAHRVGALVWVDGVHYTPHQLVDVAAWEIDFYAASAYKFFGPHSGLLYGKAEHLEQFQPYKVRPAPDTAPHRWETGTQSFESLAGVTAAVDFLASLGEGADRRSRVVAGMGEVASHGVALGGRFLAGASEIPGVKVYGVTDSATPRTSTFAVAVEGVEARRVAEKLGRRGIFVTDGHYYAVAVMERLGVLGRGGLARIGFVLYNTDDEVDRALDALEELAARA